MEPDGTSKPPPPPPPPPPNDPKRIKRDDGDGPGHETREDRRG